jgi:hypothetical protein
MDRLGTLFAVSTFPTFHFKKWVTVRTNSEFILFAAGSTPYMLKPEYCEDNPLLKICPEFSITVMVNNCISHLLHENNTQYCEVHLSSRPGSPVVFLQYGILVLPHAIDVTIIKLLKGSTMSQKPIKLDTLPRIFTSDDADHISINGKTYSLVMHQMDVNQQSTVFSFGISQTRYLSNNDINELKRTETRLMNSVTRIVSLDDYGQSDIKNSTSIMIYCLFLIQAIVIITVTYILCIKFRIHDTDEGDDSQTDPSLLLTYLLTYHGCFPCVMTTTTVMERNLGGNKFFQPSMHLKICQKGLWHQGV